MRRHCGLEEVEILARPKKLWGRLALGLLLLIAFSYSVRSITADSSSPLRICLSAEAVGEDIVYTFVLTNRGARDLGDVFIAGLVPPGTQFQEVVLTPPGSVFRKVESEQATWVSHRLPAGEAQGPFIYKVWRAGEVVGPAHAWASWKRPGEGSVGSADVFARATAWPTNVAGC